MKQNLKIVCALALLFVLLLLLIKQCEKAQLNDGLPGATHTEFHDTVYMPGEIIWKDKIVQKPYPVYVSVSQPEAIAMNYCDSTRFYNDSLQVDSTSWVYSSDTVIGKKLTYRLSYKGKPYTRVITNTSIDSIPFAVKVNRSGFYITGEIGGNLTLFNYSMGADFVSKKQWSLGYRYGINQKTHNIKVGYKLF